MLPFKNILVVAPHTDDGELGAGGLIARAVEEGKRVVYFALSTAEESLPPELPSNTLQIEVSKSTFSLGIKSSDLIIKNYPVRRLYEYRQDILQDLVDLKRNNDFDLVIAPSHNDIHQDHKIAAEETLRAFKNTTIFGYELIWNNVSFNTTNFVTLEKKHIEKKVAALKHYKSQSHRPYMNGEFIFSLSKTRGIQISAEYAESFEVVRLIV